ncbi:MAG TPA: chromate efflux transporter [Chthoniobacterales bacterium]|nr:chromate efflux transporter [Chthoniobacterales bacterium]
MSTEHRAPTFSEALRFWLKLGFISFGGPTGQIAIMHRELVEKKRWIDEARFLHALNYCMLLPGPEAQQLATYVGWLLHRTWGGIVAGVLFVLPSVFILWALSYAYVRFGGVPWVAAIFYGLKPAVLAIVAAAVIRIGRKALRTWVAWIVAAFAFVALYFLRLPFPLVLVGAAVVGLIATRFAPNEAVVNKAETRVPLRQTLGVCVTWLAIWWVPLLLVGAIVGWQHTIWREAVFFSKAAMLTFGGAYAVLPYVSQQAVETYGWLTPGQMLDGLGLAETTPGPLIMVLQFVGFVGAWTQPGHLPPIFAATLGALVTTWATFAPCFLWIFAGAPYIERLRNNAALSSALATITAAVVGVILNLAVWFAVHVLFPNGRIDLFAVALAAVVFVGLVRWKWDVVPVVLGSGALGLAYRALVT